MAVRRKLQEQGKEDPDAFFIGRQRMIATRWQIAQSLKSGNSNQRDLSDNIWDTNL